MQGRLSEFDKDIKAAGSYRERLEHDIRSVEIEMQELIQQKWKKWGLCLTLDDKREELSIDFVLSKENVEA